MAPKAQSLLEERAVKGGYRTGGASLSIADREAANAALENGDRENEDRGEVDFGESSGPSKGSEGQGQTMTRVRSTVEFDANDFVELPLVEKLPFNVFVAVVTLLNILVLGLEQDMGAGNADLAGRMSWYILECLFSICFVVEMILRISHALSSRKGDSLSGLIDWLSDIWNFLDLLLVIASVIDAFALVPLGVGGQVRLFTVLRALRVVRLVRLVRTLSYFRELWLLVGGLVNSMKALGWVVLIALTVLYVCSIVVTTEIGQNHAVYGVGPSYDGEIWPYESYFGDVRKSMFSLFQVMTMDGWCDDIVRHVVHRQPWMGVFFVIFLFLTAFGLVNVVIGIIVENTLAAAQVASRKAEEDEARARRRAVEQLTDLLVRSDSRRTGEISIAELQVAHESAIVQDLFKKIGLTMEEARNIFALLDYERRGRVELKRFANSCRELVGGAKRRDIAQVEITVGTLARHLEQLDGQFSKIEAEVVNLTKMADDFVQHTVRTLTGFNARPSANYGRKLADRESQYGDVDLKQAREAARLKEIEDRQKARASGKEADLGSSGQIWEKVALGRGAGGKGTAGGGRGAARRRHSAEPSVQRQGAPTARARGAPDPWASGDPWGAASPPWARDAADPWANGDPWGSGRGGASSPTGAVAARSGGGGSPGGGQGGAWAKWGQGAVSQPRAKDAVDPLAKSDPWGTFATGRPGPAQQGRAAERPAAADRAPASGVRVVTLAADERGAGYPRSGRPSGRAVLRARSEDPWHAGADPWASTQTSAPRPPAAHGPVGAAPSPRAPVPHRQPVPPGPIGADPRPRAAGPEPWALGPGGTEDARRPATADAGVQVSADDAEEQQAPLTPTAAPQSSEPVPEPTAKLLEYLRSHAAKGKSVLRAAVAAGQVCEKDAEAAIAEFEKERASAAQHRELLASFLRERATQGSADRAKAILRTAARYGAVPMPGRGAVPVASADVEEVIAEFEGSTNLSHWQ